MKSSRFLINTSKNKLRSNSNHLKLQMKIIKKINFSKRRIKINAFCFLIFI